MTKSAVGKSTGLKANACIEAQADDLTNKAFTKRRSNRLLLRALRALGGSKNYKRKNSMLS